MAKPASIVQDDIAYLKTLAEQGCNAPILHGPILVSAALTFGGASLVQYLMQTGVLVLPPMAALWIWLGAGVLFGLLAVLSKRSAVAKPGFTTTTNRATGYAWRGTAFVIFAIWAATIAIGFAEGNWGFMRLMPALVFAAYGSAWSVSAAITGHKWMGGVSILAFLGAVALGPLSARPEGYLAFFILLVAVVLLPGLYLMRREPARMG